MLFRGCGEESHPSSSVCVVSSHQVYQENQASIPAPNTVRRPTIAHMQSISCYSLTGKSTPKRIPTGPKRISKHNSQHGETTVRPGQRSHWKNLPRPHWGRNAVSQPVCEGNLHQTQKYRGQHTCTSHKSVRKNYTQSLNVKWLSTGKIVGDNDQMAPSLLRE